MMNIYLVLFLRLAHVVGGILWVGAAVAYFFFFNPSIQATGPAGGQFAQYLIARKKYPAYMAIVAAITILSGAPLYLMDSSGLKWSWIQSGPGTVFTIGSVVAIVVFFVGMFGISPRAIRLGALNEEIGKAGGQPTSEQAAEMQKLGKELRTAELTDFIMVTIAMVTMAVARYIFF